MEQFACGNRKGMRIMGRVYRPEKSKGIVVCCHGFTSDMSKTQKIAEALEKDGYTAYIFDFCGGGYHTISDGDFHTYMTPLTEIEDLECVVEYIQHAEVVEKVILLGCSQGGFVSAIYASRHPENVEKLILYYPAFCIPDDARKGSMQAIQFDPDNIGESVGEMPMLVSGEYPRSVLSMDINEEIKGYPGKVLLLHGTSDAIVPISYADQAKEVYGNQCEYHRLENAPHGFHEEPFFSQAHQYTIAFLNEKA